MSNLFGTRDHLGSDDWDAWHTFARPEFPTEHTTRRRSELEVDALTVSGQSEVIAERMLGRSAAELYLQPTGFPFHQQGVGRDRRRRQSLVVEERQRRDTDDYLEMHHTTTNLCAEIDIPGLESDSDSEPYQVQQVDDEASSPSSQPEEGGVLPRPSMGWNHHTTDFTDNNDFLLSGRWILFNRRSLRVDGVTWIRPPEVEVSHDEDPDPLADIVYEIDEEGPDPFDDDGYEPVDERPTVEGPYPLSDIIYEFDIDGYGPDPLDIPDYVGSFIDQVD